MIPKYLKITNKFKREETKFMILFPLLIIVNFTLFNKVQYKRETNLTMVTL